MGAAARKTAAPASAPAPTPAAAPAAAPVQIRVSSGPQLMSLRVSRAGDAAEAEADAVAARIMMSGPPSPSIKLSTGPALVARKAEQPTNLPRPPAVLPALDAPGGAPLPPAVRRHMEPRLRANLSGVRVHTDDRAAGAARQLNARAFTVGPNVFFGKGQFQPEQPDGKRLLAHEITHTIQQGAVVQDKGEATVRERTAPAVQRWGIRDALDKIAEYANNIPGFRMFTIVLGVNPVNMSRVERSAANVMRAVIEFIPGGGLITQALDNHGVFDKVAGWVDQQLKALGMVGSSIKQALSEFLDSLSWTDIFDLGDVWRRAKRIFTDPIDRIINFVKGLASGILKLIKDAILRPLARLAEGTRGYDLLRAVLGQDPVTGDPYPRTPETLIGGFMKLIGQEEIWENVKKANAIARTWTWFQGAVAGLLGFVRRIPTVFIEAFTSLTLEDIIILPRAFLKVGKAFGSFLGQFMAWGLSAVWTLLEIIFAVVAPGVLVYLQKAAGAFRTILKNPIGFVGNLVKAAKLGFQQFAANIGKHLKTGLIEWLTGSLAGAGVYIPKAFEIRELIKFVLSVLGLTWANIRAKLVRAIGETAVKVLETTFDIVVTLVREGPAAAWERIKETLTNLKEMVIEEVTHFVTSKIVGIAVTKLLSMLNPAGAIIQAIIAIYNTIMFFVERLKTIARVVAAFIDSIAAIARGVIAAAANRVETTLAGLLSLAISFLARLIGLGKVSDAITNIINKIRAPIDKALDRVVDWIVKGAKAILSKTKSAVTALLNWWTRTLPVGEGEDKHTLAYEAENEDAELILKSSPTRVENLLNAIKVDPKYKGKAKQDAINESFKLVDDSRRFRRLSREARARNDQALADQHAGTVNKKFDELGVQLGIVFAGVTKGSLTDPIELDWPGPSTANYPPLYFGGKIDKPRLQTTLKGMHSKGQSDETGAKVTKYTAHAGGSLPKGGTIGPITPLDAGTVVGPLSQATTPGGGKLERVIAPFGYSAADGYQLDHVQEIQLGGQDALTNLWPLEAGKNSAKGSRISRAPVPYPDASTKLGIPELKRMPPPKGSRGFYFKIAKVTS